jgi:hypothetical protein
MATFLLLCLIVIPGIAALACLFMALREIVKRRLRRSLGWFVVSLIVAFVGFVTLNAFLGSWQRALQEGLNKIPPTTNPATTRDVNGETK